MDTGVPHGALNEKKKIERMGMGIIDHMLPKPVLAAL
jgi:hypothetical protein